MVSTIAEAVELCSTCFRRLYKALEIANSDRRSQISLACVTDHHGRFNIWAGNIGAYQHGRSSLDYRLREASQVREEFVKVLGYLKETLDDAIALLNRDQSLAQDLSSVSDSESDSSQEEQGAGSAVPTSAIVCLPLEEELQQLFQSISSIIANLYKLSIIIRRGNLNGDRLLKSSKVNVAFYETFDIKHVKNKFPSANNALVERLGKAISRRRQYLKYREQHHEKLSMPRQNTYTADQPVDQDRSLRFIETKATSRAQTPQHGTTISHSIGVSTTASTYVPPKHQDVAEVDVDVYSESSSISSCQSSTIGAERPRLPPIPKASERSRDFECPYCYTICRLGGTEDWQRKREWKRHIFKDLQPYMCTYQDCSKQGVMFEGRAEWFRHETQIHRREWCCNVIGHSAFQDKERFREHIEEHHQELTSSRQLSSVFDFFERAMESTLASCSLCFAEGSSNLSAKRLEKHLARHMEALALFALPRDNNAGDGKSAGSDVAAGAFSTTDSDSSSRSNGKATDIEEISEIDLRQKARFDSVIQDFCTISAIKLPLEHSFDVSQTDEHVKRSSDTRVSIDWLERVAHDMRVDGTYKTTYDDFMRNKENGVEASELILRIYSGILGDSPDTSSYNVVKQQDKYKEVLSFVTRLYEHRPLAAEAQNSEVYPETTLIASSRRLQNVRLAALLRDLSNDLQAALKQDEEATTSDPSWYCVKPKVPVADNTMSLLRRALKAAKGLASTLPRSAFSTLPRNELSNLFQTLSTNLKKLISLLDDTEIDQSIAHRIEQTCWSKEDKIMEMTIVLLTKDRLNAVMAGSFVSTVNELNAGVWDMLSLLRGPTSIDEDARGDAESSVEISQVLRAIAEHVIKNFEPRESIVIDPSKMQMYYKETPVTGEPYDWQIVFDDVTSHISRVYRGFNCEHHVRTGRYFEEDPDVSALTPSGFVTWARVLFEAYPSTEYERLQKALEVFRIRDKGGSPITIDRSLFPEQADLKIRNELKRYIEEYTVAVAIEKHTDVVAGGRESGDNLALRGGAISEAPGRGISRG